MGRQLLPDNGVHLFEVPSCRLQLFCGDGRGRCGLDLQLKVGVDALSSIRQWLLSLKPMRVEFSRIQCKFAKEVALCHVLVVNLEHKRVPQPKTREFTLMLPHWFKIVVDHFRLQLGFLWLTSDLTNAIRVGRASTWHPIRITQTPCTHNCELKGKNLGLLTSFPFPWWGAFTSFSSLSSFRSYVARCLRIWIQC